MVEVQPCCSDTELKVWMGRLVDKSSDGEELKVKLSLF